MPYRRKYSKYRPNRIQTYGRAGKQLYRDIKYIKTLVNAEMHAFTLATTNNFDATGIVVSLNDIAVGDDDINRTGTSVLPRFQSVNLHVNKKLTGPDHETFRVILFRYWGEAASATPNVTVSEVLQSVDPLSFLNDANTGSKGDRERRIEVSKSVLFTLDNVANTSRTWKWNVRINGPNKKVKDHLKFRGTSTEGPTAGGFLILFISDNATAANESNFGLNAKINFYDN